jgi:8-oxo-dGTP diphosphatase
MPKSDQGVLKERYQVIPRSLIFLTRGQQVLLIKGGPKKRLWANLYNGIGGHIEKGEDVYESARRELREETGLDCERLWLCGSVMIDTQESTGIHLFIFKGESGGGELSASNEGTPEWVAFEQILQYPLVEDLKTILPLILEMNKGEMIYCKYHYNKQDRLVVEYIRR